MRVGIDGGGTNLGNLGGILRRAVWRCSSTNGDARCTKNEHGGSREGEGSHASFSCAACGRSLVLSSHNDPKFVTERQKGVPG